MFPCTKIAVLLQFPDLELKGAYMKFTGIRRTFSTQNEEQYTTIGAFWDDGPLLYEKNLTRTAAAGSDTAYRKGERHEKNIDRCRHAK